MATSTMDSNSFAAAPHEADEGFRRPGLRALHLRLIYLKGTLGVRREEKKDKKFWRGAQVYRLTSLLEIGRRVKCKISF
jgi:hypothetical protein